MVHERPKHLDNSLSLPLDRQSQWCLAMSYGAGSGDPARAVVMPIYAVNQETLPDNEKIPVN
jgi:hypothetical protein